MMRGSAVNVQWIVIGGGPRSSFTLAPRYVPREEESETHVSSTWFRVVPMTPSPPPLSHEMPPMPLGDGGGISGVEEEQEQGTMHIGSSTPFLPISFGEEDSLHHAPLGVTRQRRSGELPYLPMNFGSHHGRGPLSLRPRRRAW